MKNQFTSGEPKFSVGKSKPSTYEQMDLDFSGQEDKKSMSFLNYTHEKKMALQKSIDQRYKDNVPLNKEESEFENWLKTNEGRKNGFL